MAWPDGTSEGTPWVDDALALYNAALAAPAETIGPWHDDDEPPR
jgi:hypothetical protein